MGSIANAANYLQKVLEKDPKNKDAQNDVSIYFGKHFTITAEILAC